MYSPREVYHMQCAQPQMQYVQQQSTLSPAPAVSQTLMQLNNQGVTEFEAGKLSQAIETISKAAMLAQSPMVTTVPPFLPLHLQDIYRYHWVDCTSVYRSQTKSNKEHEGSVSFLCLRALKISAAVPANVLDTLPPNEWIWVLWYNLALMYAVLGILRGERGYSLLEQSNRLFQWVQVRIDNENSDLTYCKGWSLLQMAVLNNQACVCREMAQHDATTTSLNKLAMTLETAMGCDGKDVNQFLLNLLILYGQTTAAAA